MPRLPGRLCNKPQTTVAGGGADHNFWLFQEAVLTLEPDSTFPTHLKEKNSSSCEIWLSGSSPAALTRTQGVNRVNGAQASQGHVGLYGSH